MVLEIGRGSIGAHSGELVLEEAMIPSEDSVIRIICIVKTKYGSGSSNSQKAQ